MRIGVIVSVVVLATACGGGKAPVPDNPFGVIYHPAVDLAKRPAAS